ncbi:Ubiquitin-conjugating enzyme E2 21 [Caenorhabditis elegans]|uniref:Ubiquitin-conjugating enzyme E2 21 n=1 Tax=Caenorhabditis elegans TaxID=6239 RepID=UBC21_CAEEL|nr:Ubiquitin-conjugating enzyme E2 21 [Caenorhabditis elegans]P52484.3 RecName: Full=Ubiquitin-conjugating enzyme E2 21; AltName: Full=E2 ubiquitin-conjugating enzyme 21; AltName: Full=Ubiquitin carrier protein 21; AltName: Full=Ubiquitin-protein ligase 21 [Caenorhabditis elegans]CCD63324.1 Ubiquitin-conjugating enzyme E2 21 [Caenorhabditis elegans]|eukprot:NP_509502.3 Probable ubiquitin-conjugating enzyme E2 21 [Caenorhabditis elegans]
MSVSKLNKMQFSDKMSNLALARVTRKCKEVANASDITEAGIHVEIKENNLMDIKGFIKGPEGTPYAGGTFEIKVDIPEHYPFEPPKAKFVTRIWHPNISSQTGTICLDILKDKWTASLTLRTVLLSLQAMLCSPEPSDPQDAVVAKQFINNYPMFTATAVYWTSYFANSKKDVEPDFNRKVGRLIEMGIRETEAIVYLSCNNWKLEQALQFIFD